MASETRKSRPNVLARFKDHDEIDEFYDAKQGTLSYTAFLALWFTIQGELV